MKNKIISAILITALIASCLTGCDRNTENNSGNKSSSSQQSSSSKEESSSSSSSEEQSSSSAPETPDIPDTPASEFSYEVNEALGGISIKHYNGSSGTVKIPAEIDGKKVVEIYGDEDTENIFGAFIGCSGLTSVTIPETVTVISEYAFYANDTLAEINVDKNNKIYSSQDGILYNKDMSKLILCPCGKSGKVAVPDGVKEIGNRSFFNCAAVTEVTFPNSVESIGEHVFTWCKNLAAVTIPENVTVIRTNVFLGCEKLANVTIPKNVTVIDEGAFMECSALTSITIPDGVKSIGEFAFSSCKNLTTAVIPDSVSSIGIGAFYGCEKLTSATYKGKTYSFSNIDDLYKAING